MTYLLALDQGTTSSRCILFDQNAKAVASAQQEFKQIFPKPGWVEHDAMAIWHSQLQVTKQVLSENKLSAHDIAGIGITNQRETTLIWDRSNGQPIHNAIVWQDRRTADHCQQLKEEGFEALIQQKTGLLLDAYFSATKISWLLDHIPDARSKAEQGQLAFGTIDTWLIWNLTQGELHITDVSNASRTLLFNTADLCWDEELLTLFNIPASLLPEVKASSEVYGQTSHPDFKPGIKLAAIAGDQQAALFGQQCIQPGMVKCTYGTGLFLMSYSGKQRIHSNHRLLSTIAWKINGETCYALEGSIFTGGSLIQWLRDGLELIQDASESEKLANSVSDNGGVVIVPALTGLGAPHWNPDARGTIFGLTRGTGRGHLCRAALESIALQVDDLLYSMATDMGQPISELRIDGGAASNQLLAQLQSDISAVRVIRPENLETTALGAAFLAGLALGVWQAEDLQQTYRIDADYLPNKNAASIARLKSFWRKAISRSLDWVE